jgi:hypothetical protein
MFKVNLGLPTREESILSVGVVAVTVNYRLDMVLDVPLEGGDVRLWSPVYIGPKADSKRNASKAVMSIDRCIKKWSRQIVAKLAQLGQGNKKDWTSQFWKCGGIDETRQATKEPDNQCVDGEKEEEEVEEAVGERVELYR